MSSPIRPPDDLLRFYAERTGDLVVLVDPAGRFRLVGPAAARALGLPADGPARGSLLERAHPDDRGALRAALESGRAARLDVRHGDTMITWSLHPLDAGVVALWAPAPSPLQPIVLDTAAILHDVKNPISGLRLALAAVARALGEEEVAILGNLIERLQKIEGALRRALPPA